MAELELWIDNRPLSVSVPAEDEQRVRALADELTALISSLRTSSTGATEVQLLHLTALTLADEKHALEQKLQKAEAVQVDYEIKSVSLEQEQAQRMAELVGQISQLVAHIEGLEREPSA